MKSLFPYIGGKHRVARKLIEMFPEHKCFVEVFAGAANILFAKDKVKTEVLNDINSDLINIFRVIRWHPDEFLKELAFMTHSRREFLDYHEQTGLTDVQRAARHWYKLKTTFGGTGPAGHKNWMFAACSKAAAMKQTAFQTIMDAYNRLDGVYIENDDFEKVIKRYDRKYTLFFCDPPYWQAADYGVPFEWSDHERLAKTLKSITGKFFLTINDHPDIRKLYKGFSVIKTSVRYTVARDVDSKARHKGELLIANYKLPRKIR